MKKPKPGNYEGLPRLELLSEQNLDSGRSNGKRDQRLDDLMVDRDEAQRAKRNRDRMRDVEGTDLPEQRLQPG